MVRNRIRVKDDKGFGQNIKSSTIGKKSKRLDLMEFKKKVEDVLANLIFINSCEEGLYDNVMH